MEWLATGEGPMRVGDAEVAASQSVRLDKAKLSEALAAVESAIGALGYEVSAEGRARVTALLYERMVEASLTPAQLVAYVLNTIKESVNAGER